MDFNDECKTKPTENVFQVLLAELRDKVNELDQTLTPRTDKEFLAKFLRTKNYIVNEALNSIRRYYANVQRNLAFIKGIRPSDFEETILHGPVTFFKTRVTGRRVGVYHASNWKPKATPLRDVQLTSVLLIENILHEIDMQEKGAILIFDLKGFSFEQIRSLPPRELKRILLTGQEGLPMKITEVHIVNAPPLYWTVHHLTMRFVKDKIRKRIHLHHTTETLDEFIPVESRPMSLGGKLTEEEATDHDLVRDILQRNTPYEQYWNGSRAQLVRKLSRKRSSNGDILMGVA